MSDRFTSIHLPGLHHACGRAEYGRRSVTEMIDLIRIRAAQAKEAAEAILAAANEDFHVETYVGSLVHRDVEVLQQGACRSATPPKLEKITRPALRELVERVRRDSGDRMNYPTAIKFAEDVLRRELFEVSEDIRREGKL